MGRAILNQGQLESLRTASKLSRSVVVDWVDSDRGPVKMVGVGSLVFDRQAFAGFWIWRISGSKIYLQNFEQNRELCNNILLYNPELNGSFDHDKTNVFAYVHWLIKKTVEHDTAYGMYQTFKEVLKELSE